MLGRGLVQMFQADFGFFEGEDGDGMRFFLVKLRLRTRCGFC